MLAVGERFSGAVLSLSRLIAFFIAAVVAVVIVVDCLFLLVAINYVYFR